MMINNLSELFFHTLKDVYFSENQIKKTLPKMIERTGDSKLRGQLEDHLDETEKQIGRLQKVFRSIGEEVTSEKCRAIVGIIDEANELMEKIDDENTRDAALIGAAQAVAQYKITRYGTLRVWARQLGHTDAKYLLEEALFQEKNSGDKFSRLALNNIN